MNTTKDVDILNIILIIVSLFFAFQYPFELFFFSFIVLGPIHYLTEINWLKEKNFFVQDRKAIWLFVIIAMIISIPFLQKMELFRDFFQTINIQSGLFWLNKQFGYILLFLLMFSIGLVQFSSKLKLFLFFILSLTLSVAVLYFNKTLFVIATFLITTIIHVYLFTLLFMIFGYKKNSTFYGKIGIILMLLCPLIIIISKPNNPQSYILSPYIVQSVYDSGVGLLNLKIAELLNLHTVGSFSVLSPNGVKIQTFIAFAYTYHYLNWFSKTNIIGWSKNLSKTKTYIIILLWIGIVSLYRYNFNYGLLLLFFFSTLHVLLEFPLNITTIKGLVIKKNNN